MSVANKPPFWNDFVDPLKTVEATRQIAKRPQQVREARGDQGETALHWAALCNLGLITDLLTIDLDINAKDAAGRTPLDWQNSRLWHICVERETAMSEGGRFHLRHQSEALIQALWRLGGRQGDTLLDPIQIWARAGVWTLIDMRQDMVSASQPLAVLRDLGPQHECVLHGWVMAADAPEKGRQLDRWLEAGLAIDTPDANGRTALWYAVDGLLSRPAWHRQFLPSIRQLIAHGASPEQKDHHGVSPHHRAQDAPLTADYATRAQVDLFEALNLPVPQPA